MHLIYCKALSHYKIACRSRDHVMITMQGDCISRFSKEYYTAFQQCPARIATVKSLAARPECMKWSNGSKVCCPCYEITTRHASTMGPCVRSLKLHDHQTDSAPAYQLCCFSQYKNTKVFVLSSVRIARSYSYVTVRIARRYSYVTVRIHTAF